MMRLVIFGSCVSRDIVPAVENAELVYYTARHSLCALNAPLNPKVAIKWDDTKTISNFEKRCIEDELYSRVVPNIISHNPDVILFDLLDDIRHRVINIGKGYLTYSKYLKNSGILSQLPSGRLHNYSDPAIRELSIIAYRTIFTQLVHALPHTKFILHCIRCAKIMHKDGILAHYPDCDHNLINNYNASLAMMEEVFCSITDCTTIQANESYVVADFHHQWGLEPFHFIKEYYDDVAEKINACLVKS